MKNKFLKQSDKYSERGIPSRIPFVLTVVQVTRAFGRSNGSGSERIDSPQRIALDVFGYVFIVDCNNDRVLLLNPNLVYVRDVIGRASIKQPRRLHFDSDRGHLYVGSLDGRVSVFRIISVKSPPHHPASR